MSNKRHKHQPKSIACGYGAPCPKCRTAMQRFKHPDHWQPYPGQPFHYQCWDICSRCHHIQHYERFMVWHISGKKRERLEAKMREYMEQRRKIKTGELVIWGNSWNDDKAA
jgi:hypothetical protein